jgi:hypothetical protein
LRSPSALKGFGALCIGGLRVGIRVAMYLDQAIRK